MGADAAMGRVRLAFSTRIIGASSELASGASHPYNNHEHNLKKGCCKHLMRFSVWSARGVAIGWPCFPHPNAQPRKLQIFYIIVHSR